MARARSHDRSVPEFKTVISQLSESPSNEALIRPISVLLGHRRVRVDRPHRVGRSRELPACHLGQRRRPIFTVLDMEGAEVRLSDFLGEDVLLVNVWATWCGPCLTEMPSMQRLYEQLEGEDFEILAVSIDAPAGAFDLFGREGGDLVTFAEELGLTFADPAQPER